MSQLRCGLLLAVVGALLDACSPCNGDTIFITVLFPDFARGADEVAIDVGVNGVTSRNGMAMAPHAGEASGSFEARIANYAAGDTAYITVSALSHGQIMVTSNKTLPLIDGCTTVTIDLAQSDVGVRTEAKNKVDLLFMVDDSPSMLPKQQELIARFPNLVKIFDDGRKQGNPVWYHIGVVTSDLGAAQEIVNGGKCKPGGRGGKLQPLGAGAPTTCQGPVGANYIDYNQNVVVGGVAQSNLPGDKSVSDLATTLGCMAAVGDQGCGFEHQLEAVYRAIHDVPVENQGFFRSDATLVVVWVTDEDDCSADPNSDLFSAAKVAEYGLQSSYRCTQYGVYGDVPSTGKSGLMPYGDSGGQVANTRPATTADGGKLFDVQRYIDFFNQPKSRGGAKINPADVLLAGITGDPNQVASILGNFSLQTGDYQQCPGPISISCAPVLKHSCANPAMTYWFGDPAVRINRVINAAPNHLVGSVCDTSFQSSLQSLGNAVVSQATAVGCLLAAPATPRGSAVADPCVVADLAYIDNTSTPMPRCGAGAPTPCWDLVTNANCPAVCADGAPAQHLQVTVNRGGAPPPAGTITTVTCTVLNQNLLGPGPTCL